MRAIVLTGFEEIHHVKRTFDRFKDGLNAGVGVAFEHAGATEYTLIFNDGDLKIPCSSATFKDIEKYWYQLEASEGRTRPSGTNGHHIPEVPNGVETFSATEEPPPPPPDDEPQDDDDDWAGQQDDAEDGVGQL